MTFYRRRLPHLYEIGTPVFLTWCLRDSLPRNRVFPKEALTSEEAFAAMDRLLDEARTGVCYLRQAATADMVVDAIRCGAGALDRYVLHAFAVMPNHVHLLVSPRVPLPVLTKTLKGFTARKANEMLGLTRETFWQDESYDHLVRNETEFERISFYIEQNPVRAGLVREAGDYRWSSAEEPTWRSAADLEVRPTNTKE